MKYYHLNVWAGIYLLLSVAWMLYCAYVAHEMKLKDTRTVMQGVLGGLVIIAMTMAAVFLIFFV